MSRYPPLTATELRQLYDQRPTPEARRLLWEIDRLHGIVSAARLFLRSIDQSSVAAERLIAFSALLSAMDAELQARRTNSVPQRSARVGCDMAEPFVGAPEYWEVEARRIGESRSKPRR